jgi:Flp pilus assembly protein TadG
MHMTRIARVCRSALRLSRDRSGLALLEFALSMPIVLALGLYGVETANLALANLRISRWR